MTDPFSCTKTAYTGNEQTFNSKNSFSYLKKNARNVSCTVFLPCCRVAVVGNVDAGKSTLLGVLTHGELDNGRGTARQKLFRHKHEMETGRTSSVGNDILGFDREGRVVNKTDGHGTYSANGRPLACTCICR